MKTIVSYVVVVVLLGVLTFLVVSNYTDIQKVMNIPAKTSEYSIAGVASEANNARGLGQTATQPQMQPPIGITSQLNSNQDVYLLGEPVALTLHLLNQTSSPVHIHKALDVSFGQVWLEVTDEDGVYRRYVGPGFGTKDSLISLGTLEPGEQISTSFTALYNNASKLPEKLPTIYAFNKPGVYLLRVELINILPDQRFVSDPIQITVVTPQGGNATVWKLLQTEESAYFLHTGFPREDTHIVKEFEQISTRYPNTTYTPYMRASLDKFYAMEAQLGSAIQAADAKIDQEIVVVQNQPLMVETQSGLPDTNRGATTQAIVKLMNDWVKAYNAQNIPQFVQYFSLETTIRQKWEQGPGDRDRETIDNRFREAFISTGGISVEIVRLVVEDRRATADVVVSFERATEIAPHQTMKFELDDDGTWTILDAGF